VEEGQAKGRSGSRRTYSSEVVMVFHIAVLVALFLKDTRHEAISLKTAILSPPNCIV
jgi:hypothetical protein